MKIKRIVFVILVSAAVVAASQAFLNFFQSPSNVIRVGMTRPYSPLSGLFFIAEDQGYFKKRGLAVDFEQHSACTYREYEQAVHPA